MDYTQLIALADKVIGLIVLSGGDNRNVAFGTKSIDEDTIDSGCIVTGKILRIVGRRAERVLLLILLLLLAPLLLAPFVAMSFTMDMLFLLLTPPLAASLLELLEAVLLEVELLLSILWFSLMLQLQFFIKFLLLKIFFVILLNYYIFTRILIVILTWNLGGV